MYAYARRAVDIDVNNTVTAEACSVDQLSPELAGCPSVHAVIS